MMVWLWQWDMQIKVSYLLKNGNMIDSLEENITIRKNVKLIIIQFKTSYNLEILKFPKNGNMIILLMIKKILKQCCKQGMDKFQTNNIIMMLCKLILIMKQLQLY